jgi:glycerol uptake facilitator-like aquaporin
MGSQPLLAAAAASYTANCALGGSVALGLVDTRGFRWVHHALYIATAVLTAAAAAALLVTPLREHRTPAAALALLPAALPLTAIPRVSAHSRRHPLIALAAAPFYAAAMVLDRRG